MYTHTHTHTHTHHSQMCIRINNIHTLITTFPSLENQLYSSMRTSVHPPITAHGYISSDPGELSPRHPVRSYKPNPHSTRPPAHTAQDLKGESEYYTHTRTHTHTHTCTHTDMNSIPSAISLSMGPMEPDGRRKKKELPDVGFKSKESLQVVEYLQTTQKCQLRLLCLRVSPVLCRPHVVLLIHL